ncbi:protein-export chaperone SecB [Sporosarcina sp. FA9]|uniref:protein-export chaperone SecB n=1 Tax=Sporosarcina sp. FA9 TaxID=3413030 RepID=UPI003F660B7C
MNALLQFKKFKVLEMVYKSSFLTNFDETVSPTFGVEIGLNEDNNRQAIVHLSVEIGDQSEDDYLKVVIAGFFAFETDEDVKDDIIYNYYELNGTAILFPYLRSIVSDLTSKGEDSPIILPTINILALLKSKENDD